MAVTSPQPEQIDTLRIGPEYIGGIPLYAGERHMVTVNRGFGTEGAELARRIVAALDACKGMPTDALEKGESVRTATAD